MVDDPVDALRACYQTVGNLTEALIDALEFNHFDDIEDLADRRAEAIGLAGEVLAVINARDGVAIPDDVQAAVAALDVRDQRLRILMVSAVQANESQLAEVRTTRARFGGYQQHNPDRPELVDRRG
jgi:hypothetical protein